MKPRFSGPMSIAETQALHQKLEAMGDSPTLTEPLAVGARFPKGYRPTYAWTSVVPVFEYDRNGEPIGEPTEAYLVIPSKGYQDGWAEVEVLTERTREGKADVVWRDSSRAEVPVRGR